MIPTLRSETLVFATTSQPRSARTRSAPWAASNSLTATSIRPRSGASPREGIFALSMIRSDDTRGLVESSCARTRPTPPSPTIATFTRTASRWGWICLSGQNSPMSFFRTGPAAGPFPFCASVGLIRGSRGTAGPKAYLRSRDGVVQGLEGFGARGEGRILRRGRARTRRGNASPLCESYRGRGGSRRRAGTRSAVRSAHRLSAARAAAALGDCSWGSRLHQGAREATDRSHAEHPEGSAMVRLLAGLIQDRFHELHGPDVWPHGECPAGHVHE